MRLTNGLHTTKVRRIRTERTKWNEQVYAHTYDALAWIPGDDAMWRAHTEAVFAERERLTR